MSIISSAFYFYRICKKVVYQGAVLLALLAPFYLQAAPVMLGVDVFFHQGQVEKLKGKRVALVTNHTGVDSNLVSTAELLKRHEKEYRVVAFFSPEHGWKGHCYAWESCAHERDQSQIPIYSLHGQTYRPTKKMLEGIDIILYDIQSIGVRSYTYETTLFYVMEEAAKAGIEVIVFDRPNPINGVIIDGPLLDEKWRSMIGYINVPYCHGMTIGELARFFNKEYQVKCKLTIIPMKGWKRSMNFSDTGLCWIPTSPHIPEASTPIFYASTGILGELGINIGVGYTLPFKIVGAPWIDADVFAAKLNQQNLAGVHFVPFHYRPFYGSLAKRECHGVLIQVTDQKNYRPIAVQYLLLGILKSLYPAEISQRLKAITATQKTLFCNANGTEEIYRLLLHERFAAWKMIGFQQREREAFKKKREKYLISSYSP
ncbi:MAG: DUF1343 domain-containing protein [Chlamydiota bacterium]